MYSTLSHHIPLCCKRTSMFIGMWPSHSPSVRVITAASLSPPSLPPPPLQYLVQPSIAALLPCTPALPQDADLRQCAVYGLGVAAALHQAAFRPHSSAVLAALTAVISKPDARSEDNAMATENAISALGKVGSRKEVFAVTSGQCGGNELFLVFA